MGYEQKNWLGLDRPVECKYDCKFGGRGERCIRHLGKVNRHYAFCDTALVYGLGKERCLIPGQILTGHTFVLVFYLLFNEALSIEPPALSDIFITEIA